MSNRRRKKTGQHKIERNRMIRIVRGAAHHKNPRPGSGAWRDEYLDAEAIKDDDGTITHYTNTEGRILTDHTLILHKTRELRERVHELAGKHYGWID